MKKSIQKENDDPKLMIMDFRSFYHQSLLLLSALITFLSTDQLIGYGGDYPCYWTCRGILFSLLM